MMNLNRINYKQDSNSRYNDLDNKKIVFLTPKQLFQLDIGVDKSLFEPEDYNTLFPFLVDTLIEMIKETTIGAENGSEIILPIENSECKIYMCIEINGKLCKLQSEEINSDFNYSTIPIHKQIKLFQRLISSNLISLDDVAAADIDNSVYKKLVVNELEGVNLCKSKIDKILFLFKEQQNDKSLDNIRNKVLKEV